MPAHSAELITPQLLDEVGLQQLPLPQDGQAAGTFMRGAIAGLAEGDLNLTHLT